MQQCGLTCPTYVLHNVFNRKYYRHKKYHKKNFGSRTSSTFIWSLLSAVQLRQEGHLAELSAHVSGALGAEGGATSMAPPVAGSRELLETVLAEAPQMLPFEDRALEAER